MSTTTIIKSTPIKFNKYEPRFCTLAFLRIQPGNFTRRLVRTICHHAANVSSNKQTLVVNLPSTVDMYTIDIHSVDNNLRVDLLKTGDIQVNLATVVDVSGDLIDFPPVDQITDNILKSNLINPKDKLTAVSLAHDIKRIVTQLILADSMSSMLFNPVRQLGYYLSVNMGLSTATTDQCNLHLFFTYDPDSYKLSLDFVKSGGVPVEYSFDLTAGGVFTLDMCRHLSEELIEHNATNEQLYYLFRYLAIPVWIKLDEDIWEQSFMKYPIPSRTLNKIFDNPADVAYTTSDTAPSNCSELLSRTISIPVSKNGNGGDYEATSEIVGELSVAAWDEETQTFPSNLRLVLRQRNYNGPLADYVLFDVIGELVKVGDEILTFNDTEKKTNLGNSSVLIMYIRGQLELITTTNLEIDEVYLGALKFTFEKLINQLELTVKDTHGE